MIRTPSSVPPSPVSPTPTTGRNSTMTTGHLRECPNYGSFPVVRLGHAEMRNMRARIRASRQSWSCADLLRQLSPSKKAGPDERLASPKSREGASTQEAFGSGDRVDVHHLRCRVPSAGTIWAAENVVPRLCAGGFASTASEEQSTLQPQQVRADTRTVRLDARCPRWFVRDLPNQSVGTIQPSAGRSLSCFWSCAGSALQRVQLCDRATPR